MDDSSPTDRRIDDVKSRLQADLTDGSGNPPDPDQVEQAVDAATATFADAPVQDFVPLLVEHDARDELREEGLRRDLDDADTGAPTSTGGDDTGGQIHLSEHQGLAMPHPEAG